MFIGEKLIYLQMQKTGCTYIANLLKDNIGGNIIGKHNWLIDYNVDKIIIGSIRNPWHWYVSLWAYGCMKKGGLYNRLTNRRTPFKKNIKRFEFHYALNDLVKPIKQWKGCYIDPESGENFRTWLKQIYNPNRKWDLGEGYAKYKFSDSVGFMTHRYCQLHHRNYRSNSTKRSLTSVEDLFEYDKENNLLDYVIKMENMEIDLTRILKKLGYINALKTNLLPENLNKSEHHEVAYYYDTKTINLVRERERFIIEKFGYNPPKFQNVIGSSS